ncbi:Glyoxalase/fosfomycin resistance/dioxygenase domain [Lasallia pustulata]|uniref:Glyoxalase/fosfomycin resistance/dioxygenase domain n=1 Tax=Lasallia pustulata TaxID=136370 RepID=A0A1W5D344_9LECA|nr:Glyoxalase/fosfomycin resistance/dioxygenase domain [Lasallia pustulata]
MSISSSVAGPSPNAGYSLDAPEAMKMSGWERLAVDDWKQREHIDDSKQIRLVRLSHMRYMHPDLNTITQFLLDFGMHIAKKTDDTVWMRGYGSEPYVYVAEKGPEKKYLGGAWTVESYEELEKATKLPNASPIEELTSSPGGGHRLTFLDPEGFPVNLIFGQIPAETGKLPQKLIYNFEKEKSRQGAFQRFQTGPAAVHKLGHYGLCVSDLPAQVQFYTRNFNFVPSDFLRVPDESAPGGMRDVGFFAHVDRGEEFVDHHSFFMSSASTAHVHHASFEVHDFDTQLLGHQWLAAKNYKSVWGVGRHILGSQIFDYWWDTTGFMIEHYTDGDTVNNKTPIGLGPAGSESLSVWGPELPLDFLD